jgi:hypothetical protein
MNELDLKRFLLLLQSVVRETPPDAERFTGMADGEWEALYQRVAQEGVLAVIFDSIMQLPDRLQPPKKLKLTWAGSVDFIERKYAHILSAGRELAARFEEQGIRMLTIKGVSISQYYPIPAHREFGDLDVYLFGRHRAGNRLLEQWGTSESKGSTKHTEFLYKEVFIENHAYFTTFYNDTKRFSHDDNYLKALVEEECKNANVERLLLPSPDFTFLFFMHHAIRHFMSDRLKWRYFCDWAVFLHANKDRRWNQAAYDEMFPSGSGFRKIADAINAITVDYLDLPPEEAPAFKRDDKLQEKILKEMTGPVSRYKGKMSRWKTFVLKCRRFIDSYWRTELAMPGSFKQRVIFSALYHLHKPQTIWH